jgi:hypothetical protein
MVFESPEYLLASLFKASHFLCLFLVCLYFATDPNIVLHLSKNSQTLHLTSLHWQSTILIQHKAYKQLAVTRRKKETHWCITLSFHFLRKDARSDMCPFLHQQTLKKILSKFFFNVLAFQCFNYNKLTLVQRNGIPGAVSMTCEPLGPPPCVITPCQRISTHLEQRWCGNLL